TRAPCGPVTVIPVTGTAAARTTSPRPTRSSSASEPGLTVSPHSLSRGKMARSTRRTRRPARASRIAVMLPAGQAPTMTTSGGTGKDQGGVLRPDSEAVAQRRLDLRRTWLIGNEVHVAGGIRIVEVDCRRQDPALQRQRGRCYASGAARTLRMADHRLD